jgi:DNA-binding transcriptional LysR family regulator
MNLRSFDLNLLTVFDALFETQSVTRASTQLGMAQPALSHALKRLRLALEDELFIRTAQGMMPTPRAKLLAGPVRDALRSLGVAIGGDQAFDPASHAQHFDIVMNNWAALTLAAPLAMVCGAEAPGIVLHIRPVGGQNIGDLLDRGGLDLAVSNKPLTGRFMAAELALDSYVVVARRGHPVSAAPVVSAESLAAFPHLVLSSTGEDDRFLDQWLSAGGCERRIGISAPLLAAPAILRDSDMIAVLSRRAATEFCSAADLELIELPFVTPAIRHWIVWHRRSEPDPAHRWLCQKLSALAAPAGGQEPQVATSEKAAAF